MADKCRECGSGTLKEGYLFKCLDKNNCNCRTVFWDKGKVKKSLRGYEKGKDDWYEKMQELLTDACVPKTENEKYVYTIRMKGKLCKRAKTKKGRKVYVGQTGLHPYERYLNHISGYKSARKSKLFTALINFEGPLDKAIDPEKREEEIAIELYKEGWEVHGGLPKK